MWRRTQVPGARASEAEQGHLWEALMMSKLWLHASPRDREGEVLQSPQELSLGIPQPTSKTPIQSDSGMTKHGALTRRGGSVPGFSLRIPWKSHHAQGRTGLLKTSPTCTYVHR